MLLIHSQIVVIQLLELFMGSGAMKGAGEETTAGTKRIFKLYSTASLTVSANQLAMCTCIFIAVYHIP